MKFRPYLFLGIALLVAFQADFASAQSPSSIVRHVPEDELLTLLASDKFADLSKRLESLQASYATDSTKENEVHKAFYAFYRADANVGRSLNKWVTSRPNDAMAYLARGMYRTKMGWESRGGDAALRTTDIQFTGMAAWFNAAKQDLNRALATNPSLVEALCYLIEIDMNEGKKRTNELFDKALKVNPSSFIAREFFLHTQLPRWGGSYQGMAQTLANAKPHYSKVPQLKTLEGRIAGDQAELLARRGDKQEALKQFVEALSHGDFWFSNQKYGETLADSGDHQSAIKQYSKVIQYKPGYKRAWWMRALSYQELGQFPEALADITYAINVEPRDDGALAARGLIYGSSGELKAALKDFQAAAKINPADSDHKKMISHTQQLLTKGK
jgi:tetratricopeptide (TPR) repeat protein